MESPHDILKRIQEENNYNTINNSGTISPDDMLAAIQSGEVQDAVQAQAVGNGNNMITDLLGGSALGFANMLNNVMYGATGQVTRNLGSLWETVSPFSGKPNVDVNELLRAGIPLDEINERHPYENSWLTNLGNDVLAAGNYFGNILDDTRKDWLGQNPTLTAKVGEGLGSIGAFILAGLYAKAAAAASGATGLMSNLLGAATSGGLESLSESGGFLLDAYGQGKADDNALSIANKNFIANLLLNTALDATVGRFNPKVDKIVNPFYRWLASGALELVNENLQEPSQQIIEKASQDTLNNPDSSFTGNLFNRNTLSNWWEAAKELAPEVTGSTALSHLLFGLGEAGMRQYGKHKNTKNVERHKPYLSETTIQADTKKNNSPNYSDADNSAAQKIFYDTFIPNEQQQDPSTIIAPSLDELLKNIKLNEERYKNRNEYDYDTDPYIDEYILSTSKSSNENPPNENPSNGTLPAGNITDASNVNSAANQNTTTKKSINDIQSVETLNDNTAKKSSNTARIRTMKGTEVDVRYRIVDANDLITSTKDTGAPNPDYPQELQPRQRDREASHEQIERIASNPDPELLAENRLASDGAPVIGSDLVVESGNGRIMGIRKAYKVGTAEKYRAWLKENAPFFGLNPEAIDNIQNPVLVRERLTDVDRVKFTAEANESSIALMSSTENAMKDSTKITDDMLELYEPDKSLSANRSFIMAFSSKVIPENERGDFLQADGSLSRNGLERITNAIVAKAYGNVEILSKINEQYDDNVRNISDALVNAAPKIAALENGGYRPDLSIKNDIIQAIFTLAGVKSSKMTVEQYLSQLSLFDDISDEAKRLLLFFDKNKRSKNLISTLLRHYAELAMQQGRPAARENFIPGLEDAIPNSSKMDLLKKAMKEVDDQFKPNESLIRNTVTTGYNNNANNEQNLFQQVNNNNNKNKNNSASERIRLDFKQQVINAGRSEDEAEAVSRIFIAGTNFFSNYAGMSLDDYYKSKNLSFIYDDNPDEKNNRGNSEFKPRITDKNGKVIQEEQNIIRMFQNANTSTPVHELAHFFLKELRNLFSAGQLRGQALQDWITLTKFLGVDDIDFNSALNPNQKSLWRNAHEKLATAFEKYVMTGKAPTPALKRAFESFKRWLTSIYYSIRNIQYQGSDGRLHSFNLTKNVTDVFDRILSTNNNIAENNDNSFATSDTSDEDSEMYAQNVKHGSGNIFEDKKFDLNRVKGHDEIWGAHFSDDEATAAKYRGEGLKNKGRGSIRFKIGMNEYSSPIGMNEEWSGQNIDETRREVFDDIKFTIIQHPNSSSDNIKKNLRKEYEDALKRIKDPKERKKLHAKISAIFGIRNIEVFDTQKGNMYDFDIPENEDMINLDASLDNQSQKVRDSVLAITEALRHWEVPLKGRKENYFWFGNVESGRDFYNSVVSAMKKYMRNNTFNHQKYGVINDPRMAASLLLDAFGIRGAYTNSFGSGKGRNFTVWNEDAINFLSVEGEAEQFYKDNHDSQNDDTLNIEHHNDNDTDNLNQSSPQNNGTQYTPENKTHADNRTQALNDNVSVAQELERKGKDKNAILMATGLVKDDNGNWQKQSRQGIIRTRNKIPAGFTKELQRLTDKAAVRNEHGAIIELDKSKLSPNEQHKLEFIQKKMLETTLQDSLDDDALFNAYPQLRNVKYSERMLPKGVNAITGLENGEYRITVNTRLNNKNAYSALMDEVQRIIQNIEGINEIGSQFNEDSETESYNQFIGKDAAERLDKAEGTTLRMDNYKIARNMERVGKHPHNIWLATGWGRGIDRKWRMEIMDGKVNRAKRNELRKLHREQDALLKKANYNPKDKTLDASLLSYDERKRLSEIGNILTDNNLDKLLDNPDLFDAYPELRNIWVYEDDLPDGVYGQAIGNNIIVLNKKLNSEQFYSTLLHEIQHIIQNIEGFAHGSNEDIFKKYTNSNGLVDINPFLAKAFKRRAETIYRSLSPKLRKEFRNLRRQETKLSMSEFDELIYSTLSRKEAQQFREFIGADNTAEMYRTGMIPSTFSTPYYIYESSAGEVESRNVQKRRNMTLTERRLTPPDLTEDRDRFFESPKGEQFIIDSYGQPLSKKKDISEIDVENESYNQNSVLGFSNNGNEFIDTPEQQLDKVRQQYQGTDKWMKAPNGKKSNLTEKQWLQVRTPNFKRWFGDWENNPQNASKVLDDNGEPLVVYHGTPTGWFNAFNTSGDGMSKGTGAWFTPNKNVAALYYGKGTPTSKVYAVFINMRNPYVLDAQNRDWNDLITVGRKHFSTDDIVRAVWNGVLGDKHNDGVVFKNVKDPTVSIDEYILRIPNNVKSATHNNGLFSNEDNIYHQSANNLTALDSDDFNLSPEQQIRIDDEENYYNEHYNQPSLGKQDSIRDVIDIMHTDLGKKNSGSVWADYAKVSPDEAKRISEATGLDINDKYVHTIIGSSITHTLNRHGIGKEKRQDQLPITDADFERIPDIIQNADEITRGIERVTGGNNDTIVYKKRINGHVLVVEEVRNRRGKLMFHTMRKSKAGYDYDLSHKDHPVIKNFAKSEGVTSDNEATPEVQLPNALSNNSLNSQNYSVNDNNPETYNQIIGEIGAAALDDEEGTTWRMDFLQTAKNMTQKGETPTEIKAATNWELGADGKWKFEIVDGKIIPDSLQEFIERYGTNDFPDVWLSEIFDAPELYTAYPEIADTPVIVKELRDGIAMKVNDGRIFISTKILDYPLRDMQSSLLHEIQHNIQSIEGFAIGDAISTKAGSLLNTLINKIKEAHSPYKSKIIKALEALDDNKFDLARKLFNSLPRYEKSLCNNFLEIYYQYRKEAMPYLNNAGENEARNVQRREHMTLEERKNHTLESTEDTPRKYQIVHFDEDNVNYNQIIGINDAKELYNTEDESYFQIGAKRKNDMDKALAKSRPDLTQKQRAEAINEIEKLGESVHQGGNPKVEKLATHWLMHGHVILPEDNYKIIDAIRISEQHHLDPMRFDDPNEILAKYTIKESNAEKRINPDSMPEFSNKVQHDNGITVYTVDDSKKGQLAVRRIIDTHWGDDANPWCLAARYEDDEEYGELVSAWSFWNQYDRIPKRIAFRNGKLIAFSANYDKRIVWWDREDKPLEGIPYSVKENGNTFEYIYNEHTHKSTKVKETLSNGTIHEWFDNGDPRFEKLPDGTERRYYNNGQVLSEVLPDGTKRLWYLDEQIKTAYSHDGTLLWDKKGRQLQREKLPDGTERKWYDNGQIQAEYIHGGSKREFYENGQLKYEKLADRIERMFYENGNIKAEALPDGTLRTFDENGKLKREIVPLGTRRNIETYNQPFLRARKQNETSSHIDEHKFILHVNDSSIPQQQLDDVRRQYQGTSQWLKAPNGKQSNLKEKQWLQVRTPNFKRWFGDWENDPQNASKVLDENGEPRIVYHGRFNPESMFKPFSVFDSKGKGLNKETGAWFTSSRDNALDYTAVSSHNPDDDIYNVFLNIRNPYSLNAHGKLWNNINGKSTNQIVREVWNGSLGNGNHDGVIFKNIRDPEILSDVFVVPTPENIKSATKNNGEFNPDNPDIYHQAAYNPKETIKNLLKGITSTARNIFSSSPANNQNTQNLRFENDETEKRYTEGKKGIQKEGIVQKIKNHTLGLLKSLRGDFPELSGNEAARKGLLFAKEQFRLLHRRRFATVHEAMSSFTRNLRGLSDTQKDLFARKRLLDDLLWRKQNTPDAELPFGFDSDMLEREYKRFSDLVRQDKKVADAIKAEEETMQKISDEFIKLAGQLGVNLEDALRNPHYYRHTILEYANAAALGLDNKKFRYNDASLQQLVDSELRKITRRDYLKKFKGSPLDINTNYIQANGEVRAQMLTDIQVMKTLLEIKKKYDIAPKLREQLKKVFSENQNQNNSETHSQSDNDSALSDVLPEGYTLWDPAGSRLISSANSTSENILSMAIDDASEQSGLPIDRIFSFLGDFGENALNRLCVIPNEVAEALSRMGKKRDRGMLGDAARTLTDWWKKIVLFSPTRNLKYNFRNFTGDLDAVISGNPKALRFFGRAVKELTDYYRNRNATQDLQDYIERSGGMRIESLNMDNEGLQKIQNVAEKISPSRNLDFKNLPADSWNLIKDFFSREQNFTAWREHLLRYAAYLSYKQDMDSNNGTPLTWGASVPDEVLNIDDVRDRAYKMSNELLGAYDQISETGKQLRDMLIPFWSWQEVNLKRYYRLIQNGMAGRNPSGLAKRLLLAKSARIPFYAIAAADTFGKIALLTLITQMFNRFVMGDDDDELPPDVKYKPHITLGKIDGQVYYFDRIGALGDAADWLALDSLFIDAKELRNGQLSMTDYMKKIATAPVGKFLNSVNPFFRLPYEVMLGRSLFPEPSRPTNIQDSKKYIAQAFGLSWPYKAITGEPHSNWDEFRNLFVYSTDADEAAYFYALDKVREFQERVLGKSFNGFATSKRGQVLRKLKTALRLHDNQTVRECIREYEKLAGKKKDGSKNTQGLKTSLKSMNPLYGLSEEEQKKFMRWLDDEDKTYLRRADKYFHRLADKYIK